MLVEIIRYEVRGNEDLLTNDFDEALDYYNSLEGEKVFWDLKHMELLASSQDDDVCPDSGNFEDDLPF